MNPRVLFGLLLLFVFLVAAIVGSRIGRPTEAPSRLDAGGSNRPDRVSVRGTGPPESSHPAAATLASKPADKERLAHLLDQYHEIMADKSLTGEDVFKRIPKDLKFNGETGWIARDRYMKELAAGRLDADWLWIVFKSGGDGLNRLLLDRLRDSAAEMKEKEAILAEVYRFSGPAGIPGVLRIDDPVFHHSSILAMSQLPVDRKLAACLMGNRDTEEGRNLLWWLGGIEKDPATQVMILESLARVATPSLQTWDRVGKMTLAYDPKALSRDQFDSLIAAQREIRTKCEEAYRRDHPTAPK